MKIDGYHVEQQGLSTHQKMEKEMVTIEIQQIQRNDQISISEEGIGLQRLDELEEDYLTDADKRKIELIESFMSWLTGEDFKFSSVLSDKSKARKAKAHAGKVDRVNNKWANRNREKTNKTTKNVEGRNTGQENPEGSTAIRVTRSHEVYEKEQVDFSSKGEIRTEDGRTIDFNLNMHMSRETYEKNESVLQIGEFHDPLVLNFDGKGVDFSDEKFEIDLDLDGKIDTLNFLGSGNGFLVLDKNGNGKVDDGSELFGPETNRGFDELAAFDGDDNGWIDENDEIFNSLKIWTIDDTGEKSLIGLKEKGVGAIYLGAVATKYTLKHGDEDLARLNSSSIYLKENGEVNAIHQVDYKI